MGKKNKKQFINKKRAQNFTLVHRSQRDPLQADEESTQHVLVPSGSNNVADSGGNEASASRDEGNDDIVDYGIFYDDDYDYSQHLKERGGGTVYLSEPIDNKNKNTKKFGNIKLPAEVLPSLYEEDVGMLNKGILPRGPQPDWDPDIVAALDDDVDFEDPANFLEDDFMNIANASPSSQDDYQGDKSKYQDTYAKQVGSDEEGSDQEWETDSNVSDVGSDDLGSDDVSENSEDETKSRFTSYSMTSSVIRRTEGLKILDDRFDKIMEEYDEEEIGAVDHEDLNGVFNVKNDLVEQIVEKYIDSQRLHDLSEIEVDKDIYIDSREDEENFKDADVDSAIFAQFEKQPKNEWDCESVISTYSNIYNHPKLLDLSTRKAKKIELHKRTGIPVGVFEKSDSEDEESSDEELSEPRKLNNIRTKDESLEEKKLRKQEVKNQRKNRRNEKKMNKLMFKHESLKQEKSTLNTAIQKGIKI